MKNLLSQVCLPLLKFTNQDAVTMKLEPETFCEQLEDCIHGQKLMVLKSQACKLIEHFSDGVEGASTYISSFVCSAIN